MLAAIGKDDTQKEVESMASKLLKAKLWDDENGGKWKSGVMDIQGEVLCGKLFSSVCIIPLILVQSHNSHSLAP